MHKETQDLVAALEKIAGSSHCHASCDPQRCNAKECRECNQGVAARALADFRRTTGPLVPQAPGQEPATSLPG